MSRIKNDSFTPGDAITASEVNSKFSDVATATTAINEENVRNEGVDLKNIDDTGIVKEWYIHQNAATAATTYAAVSGAAAFAINHDSDLEIDFGASGITLSSGDMLRLHYAVRVESNTFTGVISQLHLFAIFPAWDITSNALANYEVFPDHADLLPAAGAATNFPIEDVGGGTENYTSGYAVYPCWGLSVPPDYLHKKTLHGSLTYIHTGADQTVYGIRLYGRGPLLHYWDAAGPNKSWRYGAATSMDIDIERGHMMAQVLQKGKV